MPELEPKKKDLALDAMKPKADAKKPADGVKPNPLKGMSLEEQQALLKPAAATQTDPNARKAGPALPEDQNPYDQVVALLAQHKISAAVVPRNIKSFEYNKGSGQLTLNLAAGFTKEITDEKGGKHQVKFDQRILMSTFGGRLTSIQGVTVPSSHGARLTDIEMAGGGVIRLTGRVGIFAKSLEIKEADFPPLP